MLQIQNLYAGYNKNNPILKGVDLTVNNGEVLGILGQNGSGKSTLAKAICGLVPYTDGEIFFNGQSLKGLSTYEIVKMGIGYFQQGGRVFPNLTVLENIAFASGSLTKKEIRERTEELSVCFELLQKPERLKLNASYLSGGEKHQLALAMVLIQKPIFLIFDEPSAGLSPSNQKIIYNILTKIRENEKPSMMIIEQNVELAKAFTQIIFQLLNGKF